LNILESINVAVILASWKSS